MLGLLSFLLLLPLLLVSRLSWLPGVLLFHQLPFIRIDTELIVASQSVAILQLTPEEAKKYAKVPVVCHCSHFASHRISTNAYNSLGIQPR